MKAFLKNYRQSPRKVRLVADSVRGKNVASALSLLKYAPKRAAEAVAKLIASAAANASNNDGKTIETLKISKITVDEGPTLKRFRPRARGMASAIHKRTSRVTVELAEAEPKPVNKTVVAEKPAKKAVTKK